MFHTILVLLHIFICIGLVALILMQQGKGADMGAAFGSGASSTVFGSQGSGNFLTRLTSIFAASFFLVSLILAYFVVQSTEPVSIVDTIELPATVVEQPQSEVPVIIEEQPAVVPTETNELPPAE